MKPSAFLLVTITTVLLLAVTIMSAVNFAFPWVFYLTVIGQIAVVFMVYKILHDKYTTTKTFDDFYEDHPMDTFMY
ncbi:hypothetical protein DFQ11_10423 [Winogradskyella epiphytica]|uniref:Uncharacterized protein n=1 Tax=Winogradskyella epiphytica TaxID=262005 RepID=A0A2V4X660_9FLAO|nr:hypothetical protein [Winogradskyella epiphytica]PYE80659.1 hypothetical protein DFQ11_10423 [Winogradskyella epiphytica]GGW67519.1 hypothetical protein GCM10008085_19210 [Winogradskyella epiphytica]